MKRRPSGRTETFGEDALLSALGAGLYSIGIPKDSIVGYETALKAAKFLIIAHGTVDEMAKAKSILETSGAAQVTPHQR